MINPKHLQELVIRPVLHRLGMWSHEAEVLLLGTAAQESGLGKWLKQIGSGPALGIYQMEPATYLDIHQNYLAYRKELAGLVASLEIPGLYKDDNAQEMAGNLYYATAMARVHYYRVPRALPPADDLHGMAEFWKQYYNTEKGHGTVAQFITNYRRLLS